MAGGFLRCAAALALRRSQLVAGSSVGGIVLLVLLAATFGRVRPIGLRHRMGLVSRDASGCLLLCKHIRASYADCLTPYDDCPSCPVAIVAALTRGARTAAPQRSRHRALRRLPVRARRRSSARRCSSRSPPTPGRPACSLRPVFTPPSPPHGVGFLLLQRAFPGRQWQSGPSYARFRTLLPMPAGIACFR